MEASWVVWMCASCDCAYGRSRSSKDSRCPHCNEIERNIMSRHENAVDAKKAVMILNTPPEIRTELNHWISKNDDLDFRPPKPQNVDGNRVLELAEDEEGMVSLNSIQSALNSLRSSLSAEEFADNACAAGELMNCGEGIWQRM